MQHTDTPTGEIRPKTTGNPLAMIRLVVDNAEKPTLNKTKKTVTKSPRDAMPKWGIIRSANRSKTQEFEYLEWKGAFKPPNRKIADREDLTFTTRDEQGRFVNWKVPEELCVEWWGNGVEIGKMFFEEIKMLANNDPIEAFNALRYSWSRMNQGDTGVEGGFMESFARAAIAGILAYPEGIPDIQKPKKTVKRRKP
jgi:hypothetical protein